MQINQISQDMHIVGIFMMEADQNYTLKLILSVVILSIFHRNTKTKSDNDTY